MATEPDNDPARPKFIWARQPTPDERYFYLAVDPTTLQRWAEMRALSKVGEYLGLVHGRFGDYAPAPGTHGLKRPAGIWQGLKRPLHDGTLEADSDVLVYATRPFRSYVAKLLKDGSDTVETTDRPPRSVFTTFVSLSQAAIDALPHSMHTGAIRPPDGVVLFWEWTEASPGDPSLPADHDSRYEQRLFP